MSNPPSKVPQLAYGTPNPVTRLWGTPVIDRLMYRTAVAPNGCWEWAGATNPQGYGHIRLDYDGPLTAVYVVAYRHFIGPVPAGLEIDHRARRAA